jgi:phosphoribosylformylglycinamidine (FGAM) synthase-like enzyme
MGASHFLKVCHGRKEGLPPRLDIARELAVQNSVRELIRAGFVKSAHDCSEGGLAVAVAECCFNSEGLLGAKVSCSRRVGGAASPGASPSEAATALFNESQSRIVISVAESDAATVLDRLEKSGVPALRLGVVGGETLSIEVGQESFQWPIAELFDDWHYSIERSLAAE